MNALRGATTIDWNTEEAIREGVLELWDALNASNSFAPGDIVSVIFTCTADIDAAYPGKYVRLERGLSKAAILHFNEMKVQHSLRMCIRVMIQLDLPKDISLTPVYLHGAAILRPDLKLPEKQGLP